MRVAECKACQRIVPAIPGLYGDVGVAHVNHCGHPCTDKGSNSGIDYTRVAIGFDLGGFEQHQERCLAELLATGVS